MNTMDIVRVLLKFVCVNLVYSMSTVCGSGLILLFILCLEILISRVQYMFPRIYDCFITYLM